MKYSRTVALVALTAAMMIGISCKKKVAMAPPPPPPPPETSSPAKPVPPPERAMVSTPAPPASTPAPRYPSAATRARIDELLARIEDAYFDYDKATLRPDAVKALQADATELRDIVKDYPDYKMTIEGHCDERGSAEYNMALGEKRAETAKDFLTQVGVPSAQLSVISYGKERPVCQDHDETCWQKNRRSHIVAMAQNH